MAGCARCFEGVWWGAKRAGAPRSFIGSRGGGDCWRLGLKSCQSRGRSGGAAGVVGGPEHGDELQFSAAVATGGSGFRRGRLGDGWEVEGVGRHDGHMDLIPQKATSDSHCGDRESSDADVLR